MGEGKMQQEMRMSRVQKSREFTWMRFIEGKDRQ